ncbi:hypothetical protein IEQ34_012906 [Dendrobium chrysotoxum]|uniref:Uncharacterized protein n=1 Tax=Dendrobium chrysotoxum TaxID=161865 RepID=A0AAV7GLZ7_DENCH|nr:hypothetical protein IEQ34_012906 [Dendrobium chrysotoxum]
MEGSRHTGRRRSYWAGGDPKVRKLKMQMIEEKKSKSSITILPRHPHPKKLCFHPKNKDLKDTETKPTSENERKPVKAPLVSTGVGIFENENVEVETQEVANTEISKDKVDIELIKTEIQVRTAAALAFFLPDMVSRFTKSLLVTKNMISGAVGNAGSIEHAVLGLSKFVIVVLRDNVNLSGLQMSTSEITCSYQNKNGSTQIVLDVIRQLPASLHNQSEDSMCQSVQTQKKIRVSSSIDKLISSKPLSVGYLLSVAELKASSLFSGVSHVINDDDFPNVSELSMESPSEDMPSEYEFPRMPPWFLNVRSQKLYLALARILRLVDLSATARNTSGVSLLDLIDNLLEHVRKLISEVRMKGYNKEGCNVDIPNAIQDRCSARHNFNSLRMLNAEDSNGCASSYSLALSDLTTSSLSYRNNFHNLSHLQQHPHKSIDVICLSVKEEEWKPSLGLGDNIKFDRRLSHILDQINRIFQNPNPIKMQICVNIRHISSLDAPTSRGHGSKQLPAAEEDDAELRVGRPEEEDGDGEEEDGENYSNKKGGGGENSEAAATSAAATLEGVPIHVANYITVQIISLMPVDGGPVLKVQFKTNSARLNDLWPYGESTPTIQQSLNS